jgi:hypothetical protein
MSGGYFNYDQFRINDIATLTEDYLVTHREELPEDIQRHFQDAIKALLIAATYAQRIDWFISGDDGEDSFRSRLAEDLRRLQPSGVRTFTGVEAEVMNYLELQTDSDGIKLIWAGRKDGTHTLSHVSWVDVATYTKEYLE